MKYLKDLPEGTIWPHLLDAIRRSIQEELHNQYEDRRSAIVRGLEPPAQAAPLYEKFSMGVIKTLHIVGIEMDISLDENQLKLAPDYVESRSHRWNGKSSK